MPSIDFSRKKLFIFDVDGTLVNAYPAIKKSLNYTLRKLNLTPVSLSKVRKSVGRGDKIFIETFFPEELRGKALKIYRRQHKKDLAKYVKTMPYSRYLLNKLKRKGKFIAVASNRPAVFTRILLKSLGLLKYFDFVACADEVGSLKPNPKILNLIIRHFKVDKTQVLFSGGVDIDLETARRAKIDAVFIKGGSSSIASIRKYNAQVLALKDMARYV